MTTIAAKATTLTNLCFRVIDPVSAPPLPHLSGDERNRPVGPSYRSAALTPRPTGSNCKDLANHVGRTEPKGPADR